MAEHPFNQRRASLAVLLALLLGSGGGAPVNAASANASSPAYYPITLDPDGGVQREALDRLSQSIRPAAAEPHAQVIVLVHGYNTSGTLGRRQYRQIARDLATAGSAAGWRPVVIGVHWASHPGPLLHWLPQMLGYRFISGAGFPKALSNPYLEKSRLAAKTGKTGLRSVLFRLRDDYPRLPLHVFAHSMGSELVIRALSPESPAENAADPITQPERILHLGMVVLAGADLDQDVFSPDELNGVPQALPRAAVWWITVPRRNTADAALELRRSAGRRDAMGNVGLTLRRDQLTSLLARRGLVIDNRKVPIVHDILAYFTPARLDSLARSLAYLTNNKAGSGPACVLQELDTILASPRADLSEGHLSERAASARLYVRWRLHPERLDFGSVRVADEVPLGTNGAVTPACTLYLARRMNLPANHAARAYANPQSLTDNGSPLGVYLRSPGRRSRDWRRLLAGHGLGDGCRIRRRRTHQPVAAVGWPAPDDPPHQSEDHDRCDCCDNPDRCFLHGIDLPRIPDSYRRQVLSLVSA